MVGEGYVAIVGIDWADQRHATHLIDLESEHREEGCLDQQPGAIDEWVAGLRQRFPDGKIAVCLEQKRGALIYALMKFDNLILIPINPAQLANYRAALAPSGSKDDPNDAALLAELAWKHPDRLRAWLPDSEDTRLIGQLTEDRRRLVEERNKLTNRVKSRLKSYFPLALEITSRLFSNVACQLLMRYPTLGHLQAASHEELQKFYHDVECYHPSTIEKRMKAIDEAKPLTTDRAIVESSALRVQSDVSQILVLNDSIEQYDEKLASLMQSHPDAEIFQALPGAGAVMAARLLAALGSDRDRVADAQEVQQMAGIAPVTRKSGKSNVVKQRWACNKFLRQTFHEFAAHSIKQSGWAKAYYDMLICRGKKHQAAIRALAFKWIRVIVRCWKTNTLYDELTYLTSLRMNNSPLLQYLRMESESNSST